jgi:hypothetical protein
MQKSRLAPAIVAVLIAITGTAVAGERQDVNGVTILRGRTPTPPGNGIGGASGVPGGGSGGSVPRTGQSGALNALHTGSANAGGQFNNIPPGAGR